VITTHGLNGSRVSFAATARYKPGIGRVGFVLVDLGAELQASIVDRKDVDFAAPLPERVREQWACAELESGRAYRLFFQIYDQTGVNLVAYDRRDFICPDPKGGCAP